MQDNQTMDAGHDEHHLVTYRVYVWVWLGLLALTGLTVGAKYADLQHIAIIAALMIATVKATLVLLYFMHIRFEKPIFAVMIAATLLTYVIFIALTFTDYPFR